MSKQAIDGQRVNAFLVDPNELTIIGHDTKDGPEHPLWDPRVRLPLDEGMILDLMEIGQIHDVVVRKNGDRIEVLAGRQRTRAIREINKRNAAKGHEPMKVRVTVRKPLDRRSVDADALGVGISENENRVDDDYVAKCGKAERLLAYGKTKAEVARRFGISEQSLNNLLQISQLSDKVRGAIQAKEIGFIAAIQLADLSHEEQDQQLATVIEQGGVSSSEMQRLRKERAKKKTNGHNKPAESETPRAKPPTRKVLRKVSENEEFLGALSPDAKAILLWVLGDENAARRVKGLTALLREE